MKRILSFILIICALACVVTGCGAAKKDRILFSDVKLSKAVELGEYKGIKVDTSSDKFKEFYDAVISADVESNDFYVKKSEGKVAKGDVANIDYEGKKDGVAFEGGTAKGYDLEIGSGSFIDGFEDGLIGVEIGKTVDLNLTFPENYSSADLAGKAVVFTVKVNYVKTKEERKPEDYYSELKFDSLDAYKKDVTERAVKDYLIDNVVEGSKIKEYPENDVNTIYNASKKTVEINIKNQYGVDLATYLQYMSQTEADFKESMVTEQIKPMMDNFLVFYGILDNEELPFESKEIEAEISKTVKEIGNINVDADYLKQYYGEYYFEVMVVRDKVVEFMYENAKIS